MFYLIRFLSLARQAAKDLARQKLATEVQSLAHLVRTEQVALILKKKVEDLARELQLGRLENRMENSLLPPVGL